MPETEIFAVRDDENERPIPTAWRPVISDIVKSFVAYDYGVSSGVAGVVPVLEETVEQIKAYIHDYGDELIELPQQTWDTSVCLWMGNHWDVLVDLWTAGEGQSDLVLSVKVIEAESGYQFSIEMVYVP